MTGVPHGPDPVVRLFAWTALVVSLAVQVVGLYAAGPPPEGGVPGLDKVGHLLAFGVPAALAWGLGARWVLVLLVLHALASEPLQGWLTEHRQPDPLDLLADLVGIALGVGVAAWTRRRWAMMRA